MACSCAFGKRKGYYSSLLQEKVDDSTNNAQNMANGFDDDLFEVEKLVEKKMVKGRSYHLVLWKDYSKEEATWIDSCNIREEAIRMYNEPSPPTRVVLDSVSDLKAAIHSSLLAGLLKRCHITIPFPRYSKGNKVAKKPGRLYRRDIHRIQ
uniref:Chromo domain-containing protein n=1 Tax=Amphimedon queenslandica TaxID=400682 RepID=A0A1X7VAV0_AMPQE